MRNRRPAFVRAHASLRSPAWSRDAVPGRCCLSNRRSCGLHSPGRSRTLSVCNAHLPYRTGCRRLVYGTMDGSGISRPSVQCHVHPGIDTARGTDHIPYHTRTGPDSGRTYANHAGMIIIRRIGAGVKESARADMSMKVKVPAQPDTAFRNYHHVIEHAVVNHGVIVIHHFFVDHAAYAFQPVFPFLLKKEIRGDLCPFFTPSRCRKECLVGAGNGFKGIAFQVFKKNISIERALLERIEQGLCARDRVYMINTLKRFSAETSVRRQNPGFARLQIDQLPGSLRGQQNRVMSRCKQVNRCITVAVGLEKNLEPRGLVLKGMPLANIRPHLNRKRFCRICSAHTEKQYQ